MPIVHRHFQALQIQTLPYQANPLWTQIAAAIATCTQLGLQASGEYFRLDALGYDEKPDAKHDWHARVAFARLQPLECGGMTPLWLPWLAREIHASQSGLV